MPDSFVVYCSVVDDRRWERLEHNVRDIGHGVVVIGFLLIALLLLLIAG
jgi:hypothetical protein